MKQRAFLVLLVVGAAITPAGCSHFDTTRRAAPRLTLGEEIVRVFCERMASEANPSDVMGLRWRPVCRGEAPPPVDAPRRLVVLMEHRTRLARALDQVLPEAEIGDDLGHFLGELMPLMDNPRERVPASTRLLADFLDRLSSDDAAIDALSRMGTREGYRPLRLALGVVRPFLAYPEFDQFAELALRTLTDEPDDPTDGLAASQWRDVGRALSLRMAAMEPAEPLAPGEVSTLFRMRDLLFRHDDAFGSGGSPRYVLVRDARGLAMPAGGAVTAPFVDLDSDGLADVDPLGRFVDGSGALVDVPRPFRVLGEAGIARDSAGRALRGDGSRVWEYVEADSSMLGGVVREAQPWFATETPTALDLARGLPALLGPEAELTETYGAATLTYAGRDTRGSSILDVVYALGEALHRDETDRALALTQMLLRDHESETAGLVHAARYMTDRGDTYPMAALEQPNVFWDDLLDLAITLSHEPGLIDAFLRAMADPRSARLGDVYGGLMRHRDRITYDPGDINGAPLGMPLDEPVDRARPDVDGNESLFQRSVALIDALNGVQVCNRAGAVMRIRILGLSVRWPLLPGDTLDECELIRIDNVAEAYAEAILGRYELELQSGFLTWLIGVASGLGINVDQALEEASGIDGLTRHPTPQALNRLVFWGLADGSGMRSCTPTSDGGDCNSAFAGQLFTPVVDQRGNRVIETYHGTIFAWEQPGFYEGMTPLLDVLHRPEYRRDEEGRYIFGDLITRIHRHWATREHWHTSRAAGARDFSYQEGGRRYEQLIADGLIEGRLLERLQELNVVLDAMEVEPGRDGIRVLAEAAEALIDPDRNPGLTTRAGASTIAWNDGSDTFAVTPMLLVLEAMGNIDRDFARGDGPARRESWEGARGRLARQFLGTRTVGEGFAFENQRARAILTTVLPFFRERLAERRAAGDLVEWSRGLTGDVEELLRDPAVLALIFFLDRVQDDPEARDALSRLIGYLVDEASANDAFISTLYGGADALMVLEDDTNIVPLMHALSQALAPNARDLVGGAAGEPDVDGSMATDALSLIREIQRIDDRSTLRVLLANLVQIEGDDERTPLEEILDVISEVNRAEPGAGGFFEPPDYVEMMGTMQDFMLDDERGMERLYDVMQERELR